jgi:hypothetical protein
MRESKLLITKVAASSVSISHVVSWDNSEQKNVAEIITKKWNVGLQ